MHVVLALIEQPCSIISSPGDLDALTGQAQLVNGKDVTRSEKLGRQISHL